MLVSTWTAQSMDHPTMTTLEHLTRIWTGSDRNDGAIDPNRLRKWIQGCDVKSKMRLAFDLGLVDRSMDAFAVVCARGADERLVSLATSDPGRLSAVSRADLAWFDRAVVDPFLPLAVLDASEGLLVHFTFDADRILKEGFHGTKDAAALSATFMAEKVADGFNFAFHAGSFDMENFAVDGFYGADAIVFRARHLSTLNRESGDHEAIFRGAEVEVADMIHLREEAGIWSVLSVDGDTLASDASISTCLEWVSLNEHTEPRLRGNRTYDARRVAEDAYSAEFQCANVSTPTPI